MLKQISGMNTLHFRKVSVNTKTLNIVKN